MTILQGLQRPTSESRFLVLDFETTTPRGRPPEPIEVAAIIVGPRLEHDSISFEELIQPPPGAPVTAGDTRVTGIRPKDVENAAFAPAVLGRLNAFARDRTDAVVAQNARYEAAIVRRFASYCSELSKLPFLDTVLLARHLFPDLPSYNLDALASHLGVPLPAERHRALPDVELTASVFLRMLGDEEHGVIALGLDQLIALASPDVERKQKTDQGSLFG